MQACLQAGLRPVREVGPATSQLAIVLPGQMGKSAASAQVGQPHVCCVAILAIYAVGLLVASHVGCCPIRVASQQKSFMALQLVSK